MNPFPASPNYNPPALDLAVRSTARAVSESRRFLRRTDQGSPQLTDFESTAFWSRTYDWRGRTSQPMAGMIIFPISIDCQQDQTARAVEDAIIAERNRLARELHDAVTQSNLEH